MNRFVIDHKSNPNVFEVLGNCVKFIGLLPKDKKWEITIKPYRLNRTNAQNSYLWGVVYKTIVENENGFFFNEETEQSLFKNKIKKEEVIHELCKKFFLSSVTVEGVTVTPSTKKLNTEQFTQYIESIRDYASLNLGVYIPTPVDMQLQEYEKWWGK